MTKTQLIAATVFALTLGTACACAEESRLDEFYRTKVRSLLTTYCIDCHGKDTAEGEFNVEAVGGHQDVLEGRKQWRKVLQKLQFNEMPPKDAEQPKEDERRLIAAWVKAAVNTIDCSGGPNPGRPTIRRLTRIEYKNTIRDLLGVNYEPADDFPADDVGYGFDNIGDVLSLPPILMEKYLTAAEAIAGEVIVTDFAEPIDMRQLAGRMRSDSGGGRAVGNRGRILTSSGEMYFDLEVPAAGEYTLAAQAFGDQAGGEWVKMAITVDGKAVETVTVKAVESKPASHEVKVKLNSGRRRIGLAFLNDYYKPEARDPKERDRNLIVEYLDVKGPANYRPELPESHRKIIFVEPDAETTSAEAAGKIIGRLASRAWRRPAQPDEVKRLSEFVSLAEKNGDSFEQGISLALQAILVSPHFVYKVEMPAGPKAGDKVALLSEYELAASLSYFLWSSMPDVELLTHAWQGTLRKDGNFEKQARRMLADKKTRALVDNFAVQWLQLRNLESMTPDADLFPEFDDELRHAMLTETMLLFSAIIHEDRSVLDLLSADFTFLNERLARHYGIDGVKGEEFRRVSLKGTGRGGILTHASVLTITSNPERTSPVKRGKWVLETLLNEPPPPPAPEVPELDDQKELTGTLRQRMEQHRADPKCASCHQRMDPLGFALENFDPVGRWRDRESGAPIDASGELPGGKKFNGASQLQELLAEESREEFVRCLVEKMLTFALGRGIEYHDECAIDKIVNAMKQNDYRFSTMVIEIVKSEPFQMRATP